MLIQIHIPILSSSLQHVFGLCCRICFDIPILLLLLLLLLLLYYIYVNYKNINLTRIDLIAEMINALLNMIFFVFLKEIAPIKEKVIVHKFIVEYWCLRKSQCVREFRRCFYKDLTCIITDYCIILSRLSVSAVSVLYCPTSELVCCLI